MTIMKE